MPLGIPPGMEPIFLIISFNCLTIVAMADTKNNEVYCPCTFKTVCTNRFGDLMDKCPTEHHDGACPVNHSLYGNSSHTFINGNKEIIDANMTRDGYHCRLFLAFQTVSDGEPPKGNYKAKYIKKVMGAIPFEIHSEDHAEKCDNDCEGEACKTYSYPTFFEYEEYDVQQMQLGRKNHIEKSYTYCCPNKSVWEHFNDSNNILNADGTITDDYRREFEKCNTSSFINWGHEATEQAISNMRYKWYARRTFWWITSAILITLVVCYILQRLCRTRIAVKRKEHLDRTRMEMPLDRPEFEESNTYLLGQGGGGRVYEGHYRGIVVAVKMIDTYRDNRVAKSLRNECIIQHAFNHMYILQIFYPSIGNIPMLGSADRIDQIVVDKYGWDIGKRNLSDLLREIHDRGRPDAQGNTEWSQNYVNDIAWDIIRSLVKGVETLHTGWGCADIAAGYGKFIQSVVHRDIKLKNIGVKKDSDGAFYAVIADFGLSAVCLTESGRDHVKNLTSPVTDIRTCIHKHMLNLPSFLDWFRFWVDIQGPGLSDEILRILRDEEQKQTFNFIHRKACGTEDWMAPEIVSKRNCYNHSYYFSLSSEYHCRQCLSSTTTSFGSFGQGQNGMLPSDELCAKCTNEIFKFYRKNDIYSMGLVIWSVLKAVLGSFSGYYTHDTDDVCSYLDHPLDATTSNACGDNHNLAETSNLLLAEISKESRKTVIAKMKDARIELIRELAWQCLQPNPYERPSVSELYQQIEKLERDCPYRGHSNPTTSEDCPLLQRPTGAGNSSNRTLTTTLTYTGPE